MTAADALAGAGQELATAGVETPEVDAEWLLAHILGLSRTQLALDQGRELSSQERAAFWALVERRARREPLAYVLGEWGFRRLALKTDTRALIPRPETEVVVERCLALLDGAAEPRVLDIGTGSGAIALAIADEQPRARVTAFDNSPDALALARENAVLTALEDRARLVEHDLADGLGAGTWDLVVSNPPYVRAGDVAGLQPEIRDWEPRGALVANGHVDEIARAALPALKDGGWLVLEVGDGQAGAVAEQLRSLGYREIRVSSDLTGRGRVVEGKRP